MSIFNESIKKIREAGARAKDLNTYYIVIKVIKMDYRVIIADDIESFRKMIDRHVRSVRSGIEVEHVSSGEYLVKRVREGGYSLVLTDYDMGQGIDGITAIREIRTFDTETPIYMMSGSDVREEALRVGATGYIDKNNYKTLPDEVEQTVLRHLGQASSE